MMGDACARPAASAWRWPQQKHRRVPGVLTLLWIALVTVWLPARAFAQPRILAVSAAPANVGVASLGGGTR